MKGKSLIKLQSVVVGLFFTLGLAIAGEVAFAQTAPAAAPASSGGVFVDAYTECTRRATGTEAEKAAQCEVHRLGGTNRCDRVNEAIRKFEQNCPGGRCQSRMQACTGEDESAGGSAIAAGALSAGVCSEISNASCPEHNAGTVETYERAKKDADRSRRDARKSMTDLAKEQAEIQKRGREKLREVQQNIEDSEKALRDNQQKIQEGLEQATAQLDQTKTKALQEAEDRLTELDGRFIEMRDAVRRSQSDIENAKGNQVTECRGEADAKYRQAEGELNKRVEMESAAARNLSFASAAGTNRRRDRKLKTQLSLAYAGYFKDCMSGSSPKGSAVEKEIKRLQRKKMDDDAKLNEVAGQMDKVRGQITKRLEALTKQVDDQKQQLLTKTMQQLENLKMDYQKAMQRNAQAFQDAQADQASELAAWQQRMQAASDELQSANNEWYTASARENCARAAGGSMRQGTADRNLRRYDDAAGALAELVNYCDSGSYASCIQPARCETYRNFTDPTGENSSGSSRTPASTGRATR